MIELSKSLYNAMAKIQCQSPYSENIECLCPDKISFSLFEYFYYTKFKKTNKKVKEITFNVKVGYFEVIFEDKCDICLNNRSDSGAVDLVNFKISELQKGLNEFSKLKLTEQLFLMKDLALLRSIRFKYPSGEILYEDIKSVLSPSFFVYRLSVIVMMVLKKISNNQNCEQEILTIIRIDNKKSKRKKKILKNKVINIV